MSDCEISEYILHGAYKYLIQEISNWPL